MVGTNQKGRELLDSNEQYIYTAVRFLFGKQTVDEQRSDQTLLKNNEGFNRPDAPWLGPLARKVTEGGAESGEVHKKGE
jgi:hypothetical protein